PRRRGAHPGRARQLAGPALRLRCEAKPGAPEGRVLEPEHASGGGDAGGGRGELAADPSPRGRLDLVRRAALRRLRARALSPVAPAGGPRGASVRDTSGVDERAAARPRGVLLGGGEARERRGSVPTVAALPERIGGSDRPVRDRARSPDVTS